MWQWLRKGVYVHGTGVVIQFNTFSARVTVHAVLLNIACGLVVCGIASYFLVQELQSRFIVDSRANSATIISMIGRESSLSDPEIQRTLLDIIQSSFHVDYATFSYDDITIFPQSTKRQRHSSSLNDKNFGEGGDNVFHTNFSVAMGESGAIANLHLDYDEAPTNKDIVTLLAVTVSSALIYLLITSWLLFQMIKRKIEPVSTLSSIANRITSGSYEESLSIASNNVDFTTLGQDLDAMRLSLLAQREEMHEREVYVRTIINNLAEGVCTFDDKGEISSANEKARLMFGIDRNADLDKSPVNINKYLYGVGGDGEKISSFVVDNLQKLVAGVSHELIVVNEAQKEYSVGVGLMCMNIGYGDIYIANIRDITEDKETEKKILDAQLQAERANMAKSEFLSRMSHELRTPMNAIIGFSELLQTDDEHPLNDQQNKDVNRIINSAKHLLSLINEVLDISKVESGKLELHVENVSILTVINDSVEMIRPLIERSDLTVNLPDSNVDYIVLADKMRLKQVLINVLSNAAKYNRKHGSISIKCKPCSNSQLEIIVIDTGIGITRNNMEKLFEPFTRFGADLSAVEGSGIGLSITKRLLHAMDGLINVRSKSGAGTAVSIKLGLRDSNINKGLQVNSDSSLAEEQNFDHSLQLLLYIEDNPINLEIVNRIVNRIGDYRLMSSPSTELGVVLAGRNRPSIIMINLDMPGLNPMVAYRILRKHPQTTNTPIIAVSSDSSTSQAKIAKDYGFDAYVTNPINAILLEQVIQDLRSGRSDEESRFRAIR